MSGAVGRRRGHRRGHDEHEGHENSERWLLTYADMLTLLFVLFTVLYAISSLNKSKFEAFQASLTHKPLTGQPDLTTPNEEHKPVPPKPQPEINRPQLVTLKQELEQDLAKAGLSQDAKLSVDDKGLEVQLTAGVLFDTGQAVLRPEGQRVLQVIAPRLTGFSNPVQVEGHTDNVPIATSKYADNWDLSSARANTVVRFFLTKFRLSPDRLTATGYADTQPLVPNDTPEHRAVNRRVVVLITAPKS